MYAQSFKDLEASLGAFVLRLLEHGSLWCCEDLILLKMDSKFSHLKIGITVADSVRTAEPDHWFKLCKESNIEKFIDEKLTLNSPFVGLQCITDVTYNST
ncbi:hypothetical protein VNO77_13456 [Canavalia gladiata]|uniref:Uncharacterized protein n=1 Tax=Canavalia gladiata TaxID=3824 RepID=A0AAN9LY03_CANGL